MLRELVGEKLQEALQKLYPDFVWQASPGSAWQASLDVPLGQPSAGQGVQSRRSLAVPEKPEFGDLSSTVAFALKEKLKRPPRQIAEEIVAALDQSPFLRVEIAGPGFINFFLKPETIHQALREILVQEYEYGKLSVGNGKRAQVEFVSANPTGPLTIGHCRQAVLGDVLARLLENAGYDVTREYYYNDAGRQMKLLGESVRARYLELLGISTAFPEDGYHGEYIYEIARKIQQQYGDSWQMSSVDQFTEFAERELFAEIKRTLARLFRMDSERVFDVYYNESWLYDSENVKPEGLVLATNGTILRWLKELMLAYEKDGAIWFRATALGRPQDRVLVRSHTGEPTYRLPDMAYHANKLLRGFDLIIDIFGADHQETYQDVLAAMRALWESAKLPQECNPDKIRVLIHQWVNLLRGGQPVKMSKRMATFVTIDELIDELKSTVELAHGQDEAAREDFAINAVRYFLLMRSADSHVNFDLDLAKQQSKDNPVYYVMYAYTRIRSIQASLDVHLRQPRAGEGEQSRRSLAELAKLEELRTDEELALIKKLDEFPQIVADATEHLAPHFLASYAHELAGLFHDFYEKHRVLPQTSQASLDVHLRQPLAGEGEQSRRSLARLALCRAVQIVLERTFALLGLVAPERM